MTVYIEKMYTVDKKRLRAAEKCIQEMEIGASQFGGGGTRRRNGRDNTAYAAGNVFKCVRKT